MAFNPLNLRRFSLRLLADKEILKSPEVLSSETLDHRRMKPKVRGLYCEIIFGRIEKYKLSRHFWTSKRSLACQTTSSSYRLSIAEKARKDWFSSPYISSPIHLPLRQEKSRSRIFLRLPRSTQVGHVRFPGWLMNCWYGTNQRNSVVTHIFPLKVFEVKEIINHDANYIFLSDLWLLSKPSVSAGVHCSKEQYLTLKSYWGGTLDSRESQKLFLG